MEEEAKLGGTRLPCYPCLHAGEGEKEAEWKQGVAAFGIPRPPTSKSREGKKTNWTGEGKKKKTKKTAYTVAVVVGLGAVGSFVLRYYYYLEAGIMLVEVTSRIGLE